jgi:hypothetical protein
VCRLRMTDTAAEPDPTAGVELNLLPYIVPSRRGVKADLTALSLVSHATAQLLRFSSAAHSPIDHVGTDQELAIISSVAGRT